MLKNLKIIYTDLNGEKLYFYQFNDFYNYLEFTTQFPGLFIYEANLNWARWTVQYNIKHSQYAFVEIIDFRSGEKITYDISRRAVIFPPSGWWLTNPQTFEQIIGSWSPYLRTAL